MALPVCDLPGHHLSVEQVLDAGYRRACELEVLEFAVIGELVIVKCFSCLINEGNEIHIFDLMTNLWRDDVILDKTHYSAGYPLDGRRFHILTRSLLGFVLNFEEISIQQLGEDRHFTLLYIINFGISQMRYLDSIEANSLFFSPDTPNTLFLYGECENDRRDCILEATVGDFDPNDPLVRHLRSIQRIHIWVSVSRPCDVFRYESNAYIVHKNKTIIFDCSTRQLSGVRGLGAQNFANNHDYVYYHGNESISVQLKKYEWSNVWLNKRTRLIRDNIIQGKFEQSSLIEWWSMTDNIEEIQLRWHFCKSAFARHPLSFNNRGVRLPSSDILFVENSSKSIYRIPARCFGEVKKLTELAKDALLAVIPVVEREKIKGNVENIDSLISQVYTKIYS